MSNETETVKAEYEAYWDCPKCGELTTQTDDEHIDYDSGDSLNIICAHKVDKGGDDFVPCGHSYSVIFDKHFQLSWKIGRLNSK